MLNYNHRGLEKRRKESSQSILEQEDRGPEKGVLKKKRKKEKKRLRDLLLCLNVLRLDTCVNQFGTEILTGM